MKTTRHEPRACPFCGRKNEADTHFTGSNVPKPGDVSICLYCGRPSMIEADRYRRPTPEEAVMLAEDPDVMRYLRAVARFRQSRNARSN